MTVSEADGSVHDESTLPSASVVICAYTEDRWPMLEEAVSSAGAQTHQPIEIVIVIDHNDALLARCEAALPHWQEQTSAPLLVVANRFGGRLGSARNTGVELANGEVIAFLDDDAAADPTWLANLVRPYLDSEVAAVGGKPLPVYETSRPRWFPAQMDWVYGCYYDGLPTALGPTRRLIGASMSARRSELEAIGGFHSDNHDDMDMCHRLATERPGTQILLEPKAIVRHKVVAQRVTWDYYWRRCFFVNKSKATAFKEMGASASGDGDSEFVLGAIGRCGKAAVSDAVRGDLYGIARFFALLAGVGLAALGYAVGQFSSTGGPQTPTAAGLPRPGQLS